MPDSLYILTDHRKKSFYLFAVLLALICTIHIYAPVALAALGASLYIFNKYPYKFPLFIVIALYFLITSDLNEQLRVVINYSGILVFTIMYLFKFGLSIQPIREIPEKLKQLALLTLLAMGVSALFSANVSFSMVYILKQIIFFYICAIIYSFLRDEDYRYFLTDTIIVIGVILAASTVYEVTSVLSNVSSLLEAGALRFSGLYGNPNAVGLFLAVAIPLMVQAVLANKNERIRLVYIAALALSVLAMLLTNSRASLGAILVAGLYLVFHFNRKLFYRFIVAGILLFVVLLMFEKTRDIFLLFIRFERIFENIRGYYWQIACDIIGDHPLFGIGPGMFPNYIYDYLPVKMGTFDEFQLDWASSGTTHNFFLFRQTELGILGTINTIFFVYLFFYITNKSQRLLEYKSKGYFLILGIKAAGIGLFVRGFLETPGLLTHGWITRDLPFWLIFMIAIATYYDTLQLKRKSIE